MLSGIRVVVGAALLVAPGALLGFLPQERVDRTARTFARILGARHLAQAAIVTRHHSRKWLLASATIDATHATTMAVLARLSPDRRELALTNVAAATTFAAAALYEARHACNKTGQCPHEGWCVKRAHAKSPRVPLRV